MKVGCRQKGITIKSNVPYFEILFDGNEVEVEVKDEWAEKLLRNPDIFIIEEKKKNKKGD